MSDFARKDLVDKPAIIGARWWQESLAISGDPVARRNALFVLAAVGASLAAPALIGSIVNSSSSPPPTRNESRDSLALQREYGWDIGAEDKRLTFDGVNYGAFDPSRLPSLVADLKPARADLQPFYDPTLLQAPTATARLTLTDRDIPGQSLIQEMVPYHNAATAQAYRQGMALALLFAGGPVDQTAVIVDLPGPLAVAFAAGAAGVFEPVLGFRNWPHPLGIVPAHQTLGTLLFYQPLFLRQRIARQGRGPAMFVLDRQRLTASVSDADHFDNRYLARLPSAAALQAQGVRNVLYVSPGLASATSWDAAAGASSQGREVVEMDDLNQDLLAYARASLDVRMIAATDFAPDPAEAASAQAAVSDDWPPSYYGGSPESENAFWQRYPWKKAPPPRKPPTSLSGLDAYRPADRSTPYHAAGIGPDKANPSALGVTPVLVSVSTGLLAGVALSRLGTYRRYDSGGGG